MTMPSRELSRDGRYVGRHVVGANSPSEGEPLVRADVRFAEFAKVLHHGKRNIFVIEHPRSAGISRIELEAGNIKFLDLARGFIQAPRPRRVDDTVAQPVRRVR